jgi:hypothetical protein
MADWSDATEQIGDADETAIEYLANNPFWRTWPPYQTRPRLARNHTAAD